MKLLQFLWVLDKNIRSDSKVVNPKIKKRKIVFMNIQLKNGTLNLPVANTHITLFEKMLTERTPHEPDFLFFKNFQQYPALFIDVGANIGNSALSVHFVCPKWRVVSFESQICLRVLHE